MWTVVALNLLPAVGWAAGSEHARALPSQRHQGCVAARDLGDVSAVPDDPGQLQVDQVRCAVDPEEPGAAEDQAAEVAYGHGSFMPLRVANVVDLQLYQTPGVTHLTMVADVVHGINPAPHTGVVEIHEFWRIVEQARDDSGVTTGLFDEAAVAEALVVRLAVLPPDEILDLASPCS